MSEAEPQVDRILEARINLYYDLRPGTISPAPLLIALHGYAANKRYMMREAQLMAPEHFSGSDVDARADILYLPRPDIVMIDFDVTFPVPVFKPNTFGIFLSRGGYVNRERMDQIYGKANWTVINSIQEMPRAVGQRIALLMRRAR